MKLKKTYLTIATVLPCLLILFSTNPVHALAINNNELISDAVFDNASAMNASQINAFLNSFSQSCISTNNGFQAPTPTGYNPTNGFLYGANTNAGNIIYDAAQAYQINPEVLLATLQKEQSLVTGTAGCSKLGYVAAVGYNCPDGGTAYNYSGQDLYSINGSEVTSVSGTCVNSSQSVGFSKQLIHAAWLLKFDRERAEGNISWAIINSSWNDTDDLSSCYEGYMTQGTYERCPSTSSTYYDGYATIDGTSVLMENGATAALYDYTPHFSGNDNFVTIFTSWFGSTVYQYAANLTNIQIYSDSARTQTVASLPTMLSGQTYYFTLTAVNTGSETWNQSFTNLATSNPNNRVSPFWNSSWGSTNRASKLMQSSVAPGGTGTFEFSLTAPETNGTYSESFNLVADGQSNGWMEGGGITYNITVNNPYNASYDSANVYTDPGLEGVIPASSTGIYPGQMVYVYMKATNTGSQTWSQSFTNVATANPTNRTSSFTTASWSSANRPTQLMQSSVAPGGTGTFYFALTAPTTLGTYSESFQLVADGQSNGWMPGTIFTRQFHVIPQPASSLSPGQSLSANQSIASANGRYTLCMQTDGNLVLYSQNRAVWSTGTSGKSGAKLVMQGDGNLVLYAKNGKPLWTSNTAKKGSSNLDMQGDGNLVVYTTSGRATWASGTVGKW